MKLEHKIGITVTCTFLCLTGAVIGLKMQRDQAVPTVTEQVPSTGKDLDPPKGKLTHLSVPTMAGEQPPTAPISAGGKQQESNQGETSGGSAGQAIPNKSKGGKPLSDDMLGLGAGDLPRFQIPPPPAQPAPVDPATDPSRKKEPPLDEQGLGGPNSGLAKDASKQSKAAERAGQSATPEPEKKQAPPEGPVMIGIGEQSTPPSTAPSSGERANQKAGASVTGGSQASASGQGKKESAASEDKGNKQNETAVNNKSKEQSPSKNDPPASFLTGPTPTGGTSKPTPPAPATPPMRSIMPVGGAFEGSQAASPPSSGVPSPETEKGMPPILPSNSTAGGSATSAPPAPNWTRDPDKASGNKGGTFGQGSSSPGSLSKTSDLKAGDGKPTPSLMLGGEKGNDDKFSGSPPPPPPSPMMDRLPDNKTASPPPSSAAPPAPTSPSAPAGKPAANSYFYPDAHSTTESGANSTAGSGSPSTAAPPGKLPYPEMPATPLVSSSPSGTERVKPVANGGTATAPQTVARPQPQVIVYDEQEYHAAAGDTFDKISAKYYGTPAFAQALKQHNRHHARASLQMANEGILVPGERLYIPPADILEQRYGDTIVKPPSSPSQAVPASFTSPSVPPGK